MCVFVSSLLRRHELSELFFKLGYTIHSSVIEEAVRQLFPAADDGLIFEDCVHVLAYIRANEGFSKEEARKDERHTHSACTYMCV